MRTVRVVDSWGRGFETKKAGDVGFDLVATVERQGILDRVVSFLLRRRVHVLLPLVGRRNVSSGIFLSMQYGVWCQLHARSSIARKKLQLLGGVIDSGYRGELFAVLHNFGFVPRLVEEGERYAQVIFYAAIRPRVEYIQQFDQQIDGSIRGDTGFGSTGA